MTDPQAPASSPPTINLAHVTAAGSVGIILTNSLAGAYEWILTWPLKAPSHEVTHDLAILTLSLIGGGGFAALRSRLASLVPVPPAPKPPEPPHEP